VTHAEARLLALPQPPQGIPEIRLAIQLGMLPAFLSNDTAANNTGYPAGRRNFHSGKFT